MPRTASDTQINTALVTLIEASEPLTRKGLGLSTYFINKMIEAGQVEKIVNAVKVVNAETGEPDRGHPANAFKLTRKGRDKARRLRQRSQA